VIALRVPPLWHMATGPHQGPRRFQESAGLKRDNLSSLLRGVLELVDSRSKTAGVRPPCRITRVDLPGDTSVRWRITVPAFGGAPERLLLAKHYSLTSRFHQDVAHEYRGLLATHRAFISSEHFRAPEPYWVDEHRRILVMEWCPSENLGRLLFRHLRWSRFAHVSPWNRREFDGFAQAGELLAAFQAIPLGQDLSSEPDQEAARILLRYQDAFRRHLESCVAAGLPRVLLNRVGDYVCKRLRVPHRCEIVSQHSDFGPWNILKGKTHLWLIDFHNHTSGFRTHDAAYFHAALDLWTRFRTVAATDVAEAQDAFITAFLRKASGAVGQTSGWRGDQGEALPLFRELRIVHMAYFAQIVLARPKALRELRYAPVARRRYFEQWFEREIAE
jgi:hypothetical protein